jgi:hypothetical protein
MHDLGPVHFERQSHQQSRRDGMARETAKIGHRKACGYLDFAPGLNLEDVARAVSVGSEYPHFATEARQIKAKPIERFRAATVRARRHEVGADVQNLQDLRVATPVLLMALVQSLILWQRILQYLLLLLSDLFRSKRASLDNHRQSLHTVSQYSYRSLLPTDREDATNRPDCVRRLVSSAENILEYGYTETVSRIRGQSGCERVQY